MLTPLQKHPTIKAAQFQQLTRDRLDSQRIPLPAVEGGHHRHTGVGARGHRLHLGRVTQFIKQHHLGRQTANGLTDAHGFGVSQEHVAPLEPIGAGQFPPLIHHRYPHTAGRQPRRQIPQKGGLSRRRGADKQCAVGVAALHHHLPQGCGTPRQAAGDADTQGGNRLHRAHLPIPHHRGARHPHADTTRHRQISLPQFPFVGIHRMAAKTEKAVLKVDGVANQHILLTCRGHTVEAEIPLSRRGGQYDGLAAAQAYLLHLRPLLY